MRQELEKTVLIALLATLAIVLGIIESMLPIHIGISGAKLGLANIIIILSLPYLNVREMMALILLKTLLTTLLIGTFSMFWYSLSGALLSYFIMVLAMRIFKEKLSLYGISLLGGIFHNIGQLLVACLIIRTVSVSYYATLLIPIGALTGVLMGAIAIRIAPRLESLPLFQTYKKKHHLRCFSKLRMFTT